MLFFAYYILKVIICSSVLYIYYRLFLRNKIFHSYNRFYLLATVVLSLCLPLLKFNIWQKTKQPRAAVVQMLQVINSSDDYMDEVIIQSHYNHVSKELIAIWTFLGISLVHALIFIVTILSIYSLRRNNHRQNFENICLVHTHDRRTPFSFLKNIFWNDRIDINSDNGKRILKHELAHVQEKHSHDKLFINSALIFFWCNPAFWIIRKELNMIHEFIADKKAVEDGDHSAFAAMILQSTYPSQRFDLTNNFFYSPIKRRLAMLTKNKTKVSYFSRLLVLPLAVIVFAAFTLRTKTVSPLIRDEKAVIVVIDAGHGGTDNGAVASDGTLEKDITLSLAKKIKEINKSENIKIFLTRETDIFQTPREKAAFANSMRADIFISLHVDNIPATADQNQSGMKIFVARDQFANAISSKLIAASIISSFRKNYLLSVPENVTQRNSAIAVLEEATCPTVLIEAGYISNKKDLGYLQSTNGKEQFSQNILNAIASLRMNKEVNTPAAPATFDTVPAKQIPTEQHKDAVGKGPTVLNDLDWVIRIEADTLLLDQSKNNRDFLVVFNGQEIESKKLFNKKIVAKQGLLYNANDPAMLKKYGSKAVHGVLILENATITELENIDKSPTIKDYHLKLDTEPAYSINASEFINQSRENQDALKKLSLMAHTETFPPLVFVNGQPENLTNLQQILPAMIQQVQILNSSEATNKYGKQAQDGAVEIILKNDPSINLSGINDANIQISRLADIKEVDCDDPLYKLSSATVYFSGKGFPDVTVISLNEPSLKELDNLMDRLISGSRMTFDNVYISKKDGSDRKEIPGKSFAFYDKNPDEIIKPGYGYDIFRNAEQEPAFPGGNEAWQSYLQKNINPKLPVTEGWKPGIYSIVVQFVVNRNGSVSDVSTDDFPNSKTAQHCLDLIKEGPKWIPAVQNGQIVNAYRKQPITFVVLEN